MPGDRRRSASATERGDARARASGDRGREGRKGATLDRRILDAFLSRLSYVGGDAQDDELYEPLRSALKGSKLPVFYLAIPPASFLDTAEHLAHTGLFENARLVVEKPFGTDLFSARELNRRLTALVPEERLYRIDHFLGKEPVQDILYLRFTNALFEPVWSREQVDSIQSDDGGGLRRRRVAARFTTASARSATSSRTTSCRCSRSSTMEPPSGDDDAVSRHRLDVFRSMPAIDPARCGARSVPRLREGRRRPARLRHRDVRRPPARDRELALGGRPDPRSRRQSAARDGDRDRRPPTAGARAAVGLVTASYSPGFDDIVFASGVTRVMTDRPLCQDSRQGGDEGRVARRLVRRGARQSPRPYERLLTDALRGDTTLFPRWDVIEETWRIVQPLLDSPPPVEKYEPGTWGPRRRRDASRAGMAAGASRSRQRSTR